MNTLQSRGATSATFAAPTRASRPGFTLIELLVVIAIIAILAAILFPVFAKVREKARQTACLSNEKQMSVGLLQYVQDNDEGLPYSWYGPDGGESSTASNRFKWMDAIYPYVKSEAVFNCPDMAFPTLGSVYGYRYYVNQASDTTHRYYGSYGINAAYRYDPGNRQPPASRPYNAPTTLAQLAAPAGTIWILDNNDTSGANFQFGWTCLTSGGAGCLAPYQNSGPVIDTTVTPHRMNTMEARHTDRANVIYCDGHTKSVTLQSIATDVAQDGATLRQLTIQDD